MNFSKMSWIKREIEIPKLGEKRSVILACDITRLILPVWNRLFEKDARPLKVLEAADKICRGDFDVDVADAADAAQAARIAAADAAQADGAAHVAYAAFYATNAAYAALYADNEANVAYAATRSINHAISAADITIKNKIDILYQQAIRQISIPINRDIDNLMKNIWYEKDTELGPILADALEEAGFNCTVSLIELRSKDFGLSHCVFSRIING